MSITASQIIVWLIIGVLVGPVAAAIVTRDKEGYGRARNIGLGLAGAVLGGLLLGYLPFDLGLSSISISLRDLVNALVGALLLVWLVGLIRKRGAKPEAGDAAE